VHAAGTGISVMYAKYYCTGRQLRRYGGLRIR